MKTPKNESQHDVIYRAQQLVPFVCGILCTGLLSACATGPDYQRPETPEISTYTAGPTPARTVASSVAMGGSQQFISTNVEATWWKNFGSAKLDHLIEQALLSSPTMDAARATLEQAEQTYQTQGGATQYPQVTANTGGSRQRVNASTPQHSVSQEDQKHLACSMQA